MPTYEDINIYQWVQGFSCCILEETDTQARVHMLQHQAKRMQDALELNWATAKRAHAAVLSEIDRGHTSWTAQTGIDKIRQRFPQRAMRTQPGGNADDQVRICKCYNQETCAQAKDHTEGKITYKHTCFTCYKAVRQHYPQPEVKCNRAKHHTSQSLDKPWV